MDKDKDKDREGKEPRVTATNLAVFVDGQNFITSLVNMFPMELNREDYLPRNANWDRMFRALGALVEAESWKINWYTIKELDFMPYVDWDTENLREMKIDRYTEWKNRLRYHIPDLEAELDALPNNDARRKALMAHRQRFYDQEQRMKARMAEWARLQDEVSVQCRDVTIRRTGWQGCHLPDLRLDTEKGVDVGLAVDMIIMGDFYDTAIIFSGDGDYVPAVKAMQERGKQIGVVDFRYRDGSPLRGTARRLAKAADFRLEIEFADMAEFMGIQVT